MPDLVKLTVDDREVQVPAGTSPLAKKWPNVIGLPTAMTVFAWTRNVGRLPLLTSAAAVMLIVLEAMLLVVSLTWIVWLPVETACAVKVNPVGAPALDVNASR